MTISGALSSALSGLTATARMAEVVSSNVANVTTPGYGRRELETAARMVGKSGNGVKVLGVTCRSDLPLLNDRRLADAGVGERRSRAAFFANFEKALGGPEAVDGLQARLSAFDRALIEAAARPDVETRLVRVADSARALADAIQSAARNLQDQRSLADTTIASDVAKVNETLRQIKEINVQIRADFGPGNDVSALMDQRQVLIDSIAELIPLREITRPQGMVALYSVGGAMLLDGKAAELEFTPAGLVTPGMTLVGGSLSGLSINGSQMPAGGAGSLIGGGTLSARFAIRDEFGVAAQADLDALARDLIERFADPAVDGTLAPGDQGLFTDLGGAFSATNEVGLSQRIRLNARVDPLSGGRVWRLRDGLAATAPGPVGDGQLLLRLQGALAAGRTPATGSYSTGPRSAQALAGDLFSSIANQRLGAESEVSYVTARADALKQMELSQGVDTDQEMQSLLIVEQAYAANARVVQATEAMINQLMEL